MEVDCPYNKRQRSLKTLPSLEVNLKVIFNVIVTESCVMLIFIWFSKVTDQDTRSDVDVYVTISHINSQECLIECSFRENSVANACVALYWKNATAPYQLVNFCALKLEPHEGKAQGSIDTGDGYYHVAVFAFSDDMITGEPITKFYTGHKTGT